MESYTTFFQMWEFLFSHRNPFLLDYFHFFRDDFHFCILENGTSLLELGIAPKVVEGGP